MTFQQITERRIALTEELDREERVLATAGRYAANPQYSDEDGVCLCTASEDCCHEAGGVRYQKCGGGRRVLRKKIGGD